jgi:hypothetical protein
VRRRPTGKAGEWASVGTVQPDSRYHGKLTVPAGWYSLQVRARADGRSAAATVDRFGVGEVFVVVGHSVAHGGSINLPGADDDRVSTVALPAGDMESQRRYKTTGDARFLPEPTGTHFGSGCSPRRPAAELTSGLPSGRTWPSSRTCRCWS